MSAMSSTVANVDLTPEQLESIGRHLVDAESYDYAPMPLCGAIAYLNAGQEIASAVCSSETSNEIVKWRVTWLTGELIGFAEVSKLADVWTAESDDQVPGDSSAWARPLRDVVVLGTHLLDHEQAGAFGNRYATNIYPVIRFADGTDLRLPLFDSPSGTRERDAVSVFAKELRERLTFRQ